MCVINIIYYTTHTCIRKHKILLEQFCYMHTYILYIYIYKIYVRLYIGNNNSEVTKRAIVNGSKNILNSKREFFLYRKFQFHCNVQTHSSRKKISYNDV